VCEGMKRGLGGGGNLEVLPPIPAETDPPTSPVYNTTRSGKFKILYFGNLDLYGGMILELLHVLKNHPKIQFQVRGSNPSWSDDAKKEMRDAGLWLDFSPRSELDSWLQSADAFLIPMVFDEKYRRRMETSFPSKLVEFAQFGKPLIVWGPEYCSAVRWVWNSGGALPVVNSSPKSLFDSIQKKLVSKRKSHEFSPQCFCSFEKEFNPLKIQVDFFGFLKQLEIRKF
jgi:glycosyltransferase involved in cell wall biosynthesis